MTKSKALRADKTKVIFDGKSEDLPRALAHTILRPTVQAAKTLEGWSASLGGAQDINALIAELGDQANTVVKDGRLGRVEAMLVTQAHTLDAIFNDLARRALLNRGEYLDAFERYLRLAFKAQTQCRATIETLAEMKSPRQVAFVKQANIANGPQQVNNGTLPRAEESEISQSKLLEHEHARMVPGAESAPVRADPQMAPVGAIDGTEERGR